MPKHILPLTVIGALFDALFCECYQKLEEQPDSQCFESLEKSETETIQWQ